MDYLALAVALAKASLVAGQFPAGAVLVTKRGTVYESGPSLAHNHGESMVIDHAVENEGLPLEGARLYASMHPCLMCSSKMYWAGVRYVEYVIPKSAVNASYAYENDGDVDEVIRTFHEHIEIVQKQELFDEAIDYYNSWVRSIEAPQG